MRRVSKRTLILTAGIALIPLAVACDVSGRMGAPQDPVPSLDNGTVRKWMAHPQVEQSVRMLNTNLKPGDTLTIVSVLRNVGTSTINIERVVCDLDVQTEMALYHPLILCAAYSTSGPVAPGDSAVGVLTREVAAAPGQYTLAIRHLLSPSVWVPVSVTVH